MSEIKAPSVGESITEVTVASWLKQDGEAVNVGDVLAEIESDKATVEVAAETAGVLKIVKQAGETVPIGEVLATIEEGATATATPAAKPAPAPQAAAPAPAAAAAAPSGAQAGGAQGISPAVRKMGSEAGIDPSTVTGTGPRGRVTKGDMMTAGTSVSTPAPSPAAPTLAPSAPARAVVTKEGERRVPMSRLRQKIAERLVDAQHTAAILTTFNEVDMAPMMQNRNEHKEAFLQKHGVKLSIMSYFTKAVYKALVAIPAVNARIEGKDMIYHDFHDIGIAVGTEKGLVVPVLRNVESLGFVEIEKGLASLAKKARDGKLSINDMTGGTFTISNGGTYGSLNSTPILNPPQSAILGMHKTQERPVVVDGQIVIRPMMYLALSYDHRIIDGKEAVTFLVKVKEGIENPQTLGLEF